MISGSMELAPILTALGDRRKDPLAGIVSWRNLRRFSENFPAELAIFRTKFEPRLMGKSLGL